jgi:hypothetical protein
MAKHIWVRDIESSSLFSFIIHEFLENKVSTLFIQHHVYRNIGRVNKMVVNDKS